MGNNCYFNYVLQLIFHLLTLHSWKKSSKNNEGLILNRAGHLTTALNFPLNATEEFLTLWAVYIALNKIDISHVRYRLLGSGEILTSLDSLVEVCDVTKESGNDVTEGFLTNTKSPQHRT